jgi:chemotaxis protein CheY-P-specific phosphatase CheC
MPVMDGYQVLQAVREQDLPSVCIVVSGDIQPEAHKRVMALGALDFIKKPIDKLLVKQLLENYGITVTGSKAAVNTDIVIEMRDAYQEIVNVAGGRAADLLARLLGVFVIMPIPKVSMIESTELQMALAQVGDGETLSAVCQGFIGSGIAGEALLVFYESSFTDIAELMKFEGEIDSITELELLMDVSSVLIGACLKGVADQLDIKFSQGHPTVLGRHIKVQDLLQKNANNWRKTLAIEMGYSIEKRNINCDLLLLFTEDSIAPMSSRISCVID